MGFDKAIAALRAKRSALIPYRGSGGSVAEAAGKITQLQLRLDVAEGQREQYLTMQQETARTETELEKAQAELSALQQKIADAAQAVEAAVRQEQYAKLSRRYQQVSVQVANLLRAFPAGFLDSQSMRDAEAAAERLEILKNQTITTAADLHAQRVLKENAHFGQQLPTAEQIAHCCGSCEKYESLQFSIRAAEQENARQPKRSNALIITLLLLGIATALAGAWLAFLREFLYGGIAAGVVGIAMLIAAIILFSMKKSAHKNGDELLAKLHRDSDQCSAQIRAFLAPYYGIIEPMQFRSALTQLQRDLEAHAQAEQQLQDWKNRKAKHGAEMEKYHQELVAFFDRYQIKMGEDVRSHLYQLRDDIHEVRSLIAQKQELAAQLEEFGQEYATVLAAEPAPETDYQALKAREQTLRTGCTSLTEKLLHQKQQLQTLHQQAEPISQLREELEYWHSELAEDRENARILDATMEFLQRAKENLSTAYLGTIQSRFGYYLSQLDGNSGETYLIDPDFQVQLERSGKVRELAHFSAGEVDLVKLCMRMALVDALFKGQEMFVILDDPFVNLDDAHTALSRKLLHKLSSQRQILYLTCHSSRTM